MIPNIINILSIAMKCYYLNFVVYNLIINK